MDGNLSLADVAALNNAAQTQTILSSLGRFVPWSGSSNPTSAVTSTPTA